MTTADTTSAALAYVNTMAFIYRQQMPAFATILLTVAELLLIIKKTKNAQNCTSWMSSNSGMSKCWIIHYCTHCPMVYAP